MSKLGPLRARHIWARAALAVATGVSLGVVLIATLASNTTAPPAIPSSVPVSELAHRGVTLTTPASLPGGILSEAQAEGKARTPDIASVSGSALVNFVDHFSRRRCLCWMIVVNPVGGIWSSGGARGQHPVQGTYSLKFVDARTGAFVEGMEGR